MGHHQTTLESLTPLRNTRHIKRRNGGRQHPGEHQAGHLDDPWSQRSVALNLPDNPFQREQVAPKQESVWEIPRDSEPPT